MAYNKEALFLARKEAVKLKDGYEAQAILKYIGLQYEAEREAILDCSPESLAGRRIYAKAYRDLLDNLTKPIPEIARPETE